VIGRLGEDPQHVKPVFRRKDLVGVRSVGNDGRMGSEKAHEKGRPSTAEARDHQGPKLWLEGRVNRPSASSDRPNGGPRIVGEHRS
jgi:hypothetical protein